jgi:hypothetical protein
MKYIFTFLLAFTISTPLLFSQTLGLDGIIASIRNGNASALSTFFDKSVEISMPDKSNGYSKSQAELVLKDFFRNNTVKNFEIIHKGENSGSQYCIGTLSTKNGEFRTTIFMKEKGTGQVLQEIRFENR